MILSYKIQRKTSLNHFHLCLDGNKELAYDLYLNILKCIYFKMPDTISDKIKEEFREYA